LVPSRIAAGHILLTCDSYGGHYANNVKFTVLTNSFTIFKKNVTSSKNSPSRCVVSWHHCGRLSISHSILFRHSLLEPFLFPRIFPLLFQFLPFTNNAFHLFTAMFISSCVLLSSLSVYVLTPPFITYIPYLTPLISFISSSVRSFLYLLLPAYHCPSSFHFPVSPLVASTFYFSSLDVSLHFPVRPGSIPPQVMWDWLWIKRQ
jgi:hypothetical protein